MFGIYARLLAQDCAVTIQFRNGVQPHTDGRTIVIDGPPSSERGQALVYGKILHEAGHINHSTFTAIEDIGGNLKHLTGLLEDVRMEGAQIKTYKGARRRLSEMVEGLVEENYFSEPEKAKTPAEKLSAALLYGLRANVLGQDAVAEYGERARRIADEELGAGTMARIMAMAKQVPLCKSTFDVRVLAEAIMKALAEEAEKPTPPDQPDQSPPSNQSQQGQQPDQGQGKQQGQQPDQGQGKQQARAEAIRAIVDDRDQLPSCEIDDKLDAAISKEVKESGVDFAAGGDTPVQGNTPEGDPTALLERVRHNVQALRRKTEHLLNARTDCQVEVGRRGKRLANGALMKVKVGNTRIWERRHEGEEVSTAIQILLDASSSMSSRMGMARDAALAVFDAFSNIHGVSVGVAAFAGRQDGGLIPLAHHGETARQAAKRFVYVAASGGTPTDTALIHAGMELLPRSESRKICLVITDGQPSRRELTQQWLRNIEKCGIQVIGIGIGVDVSQVFAQSAKIESISDLAGSMFKVLNEVI